MRYIYFIPPEGIFQSSITGLPLDKYVLYTSMKVYTGAPFICTLCRYSMLNTADEYQISCNNEIQTAAAHTLNEGGERAREHWNRTNIKIAVSVVFSRNCISRELCTA